MSKIIVGADTETQDELLKTAGYSWKYGKGKILCTALYYANEDKVSVLAGIHNENSPYTAEERVQQNIEVISLLKNPDVILVGANIIYDLGFWLYEYEMSTFEVKCSFIDVLQAEHILDENTMCTLDTLSWKYLYGQTVFRFQIIHISNFCLSLTEHKENRTHFLCLRLTNISCHKQT